MASRNHRYQAGRRLVCLCQNQIILLAFVLILEKLSVTKPDSYPLPRMDDCIDQVGAAKFISKFDLLKGYWQVPLSQKAREIAAFITPTGLYSYSVMPFGLCNAPATFQRLMNTVVGKLKGCAVYLDDVVVYSDTWSCHVEHVRSLFDRLAEARLT